MEVNRIYLHVLWC